MSGWSRRQLLGSASVAAAGVGWARPGRGSTHRWNVLCIVVDSLPAFVLAPHALDLNRVWSSAMPSMNALARDGFVLRSASAVHPEPLPGLAAVWTGRPGSETGAMVTGLPASRSLPLVTDWIAEHGAADVWVSGGPGIPGRTHGRGVRVLLSDQQSLTGGNLEAARAMSNAIRNRAPGRPWLGVVGLRGLSAMDDLVDSWRGRKDAPDFGLPDRALPPPPDRTVPEDEPDLIRSVLRAGLPTEGWAESLWRHYRWSAVRVLAELDRAVGLVVDTLVGSIHAQNTTVILTAASGHPLGHHGLVRARAPYGPTLEVPLVVHGPEPGDTKFLVSGLDLAPTLCDLMATPQMPDPRGYSLRPLWERSTGSWRTAVRSESLVDGRTLRTEEFAYTRLVGDISEMLFHVRNDPHQVRNLAVQPGYASVVASHRKALEALNQKLSPTVAARAGFRALPEVLRR